MDQFSLSSPAVRSVSANDAYPGDMAADSAGLYYKGIAGTGDYVFRALSSGSPRRHADVGDRRDAGVGRWERVPAGRSPEPGRPHIPGRLRWLDAGRPVLGPGL